MNFCCLSYPVSGILLQQPTGLRQGKFCGVPNSFFVASLPVWVLDTGTKQKGGRGKEEKKEEERKGKQMLARDLFSFEHARQKRCFQA